MGLEGTIKIGGYLDEGKGSKSILEGFRRSTLKGKPRGSNDQDDDGYWE
jgi:hypothetical protein